MCEQLNPHKKEWAQKCNSKHIVPQIKSPWRQVASLTNFSEDDVTLENGTGQNEIRWGNFFDSFSLF